MPPTLLFLGECGEYELLLTIPADREAAFLLAAREAGCTFHHLGQVTSAGRVLHEGDRTLNLGGWHIQARDFEDPRQYLAELLRGLGDGSRWQSR